MSLLVSLAPTDHPPAGLVLCCSGMNAMVPLSRPHIIPSVPIFAYFANVPDVAHFNDPKVNPFVAAAAQLSRFPPTLIITHGLDIYELWNEESLGLNTAAAEFTGLLKRAGVDCTLRFYEHAWHMAEWSADGVHIATDIADWVAAAAAANGPVGQSPRVPTQIVPSALGEFRLPQRSFCRVVYVLLWNVLLILRRGGGCAAVWKMMWTLHVMRRVRVDALRP